MRRPEQDLQRTVAQYFKYAAIRPITPFIAFHVPNGGYRRRFEAAILKGLGVMPGVADFVVLWKGGCGCIELKSDTGSQNDNQRKFETLCESVGIDYRIARSLEDVSLILTQWKLIGAP